ncbi:MAG: DNA recombination/repair protein RecA, partial [Proteobacteria bacterium]|nr:DNA recombination/repair protein RecA [Pseudomonadota bacterium]
KRIGQGRENAKQFLADNPDVADTIERIIRDHAGLPGGKAATKPAAAEKTDDEAETAG